LGDCLGEKTVDDPAMISELPAHDDCLDLQIICEKRLGSSESEAAVSAVRSFLRTMFYNKLDCTQENQIWRHNGDKENLLFPWAGFPSPSPKPKVVGSIPAGLTFLFGPNAQGYSQPFSGKQET